MNEKPFEKITVSNITERALIHRGTFYAHYTDKYDLLTQIEDELIDDMGQFITMVNYETINKSLEQNIPMPHIIPLLNYIEEHANYFLLIASGNGSNSFFEKILEKYFDDFVTNIHWPQDQWMDYRRDVTSTIITSVLSRWMSNNMQESKEDLAKWLSALLLSNWDALKFTT